MTNERPSSDVLMKMALSLLLGMVSAGALSWISYVRTAITREELQQQTGQLRDGQDKLAVAVTELKVEVARLREHLIVYDGAKK